MLLFFAIAAGLVAFYLLVQTVRPLVESGVVTAAEWQRVEDESLQLLERRDQLLAELQELEFEAALHKIDARDLEALRTRYALEAVELDKRLDARRQAYDGRIEAQVEQTLTDAAQRRAAAEGGEPSKGAPKAPEDAPPAAPEAIRAPEGAPAEGRAAADAEPAPAKVPAALAATSADGEDGGAARILAPGEAWDGPAPCGGCGNSMAPDSAFCDGCGSPVLRACAGCGAANRLQARFCKSCGDRVAGEGA